jgi:hypothetical protein
MKMNSSWIPSGSTKSSIAPNVEDVPNFRMRDIMSVEPACPPLQFLEGLRRKSEMIEAGVLGFEPLASVVCVLEQVKS